MQIYEGQRLIENLLGKLWKIVRRDNGKPILLESNRHVRPAVIVTCEAFAESMGRLVIIGVGTGVSIAPMSVLQVLSDSNK
jgi:hypothetical protein